MDEAIGADDDDDDDIRASNSEDVDDVNFCSALWLDAALSLKAEEKRVKSLDE